MISDFEKYRIAEIIQKLGISKYISDVICDSLFMNRDTLFCVFYDDVSDDLKNNVWSILFDSIYYKEMFGEYTRGGWFTESGYISLNRFTDTACNVHEKIREFKLNDLLE